MEEPKTSATPRASLPHPRPRRAARPVLPPVSAEPAAERIAYLEELIRWIAPRIKRRNANGMVADQFCILCSMGPPELRRGICRHADVWAIEKS
jgi:hypothetical protein